VGTKDAGSPSSLHQVGTRSERCILRGLSYFTYNRMKVFCIVLNSYGAPIASKAIDSSDQLLDEAHEPTWTFDI